MNEREARIVAVSIGLMSWPGAESGCGDGTPLDFDALPYSYFELDSMLGGGDDRRETFAERYPLFWSVFGPDTPAPSDLPPDLPDDSDCLGAFLASDDRPTDGP
jgi:hypothetical protein